MNNPSYSNNKNNTFRKPQNTINPLELAVGIAESLMNLFKGLIVVGGIIAAGLADIVFGSISANILFGNNVSAFSNTPTWIIGFLISLATSAIQLVMWSMLHKRNIGISQIFNFRKLPKEIKPFFIGSMLVWLLDDILDVSPIFLLIKNSQYQNIPLLYNILVIVIFIIVFLICSFSEVLTGNLKEILVITGVSKSHDENPPKPSFSPSRPMTASPNNAPNNFRPANNGQSKRPEPTYHPMNNEKQAREIREMMQMRQATEKKKLG